MITRFAVAVVLGASLAAHASAAEMSVPFQEQMRQAPQGGARFTGQVQTAYPDGFALLLRDGRSLQVDSTEAVKNHLSAVANPGLFVMVEGRLVAPDRLEAVDVIRAKGNPASWLPDVH